MSEVKTSTLSTLTLHRLPDLQEELDSRIREAIRDCADAPELKKARMIRLDIALTPADDDDDDVEIAPKISTRFPARPLTVIKGRRSSRNQLQFDFEEELNLD